MDDQEITALGRAWADAERRMDAAALEQIIVDDSEHSTERTDAAGASWLTGQKGQLVLGLIPKTLHVFAAIWLVAGLIGRYVALSKAEHSSDIRTVRSIMPLASVFENRMVIPGSLAVLMAGLLTTWTQGWPVLGFIQGGAANADAILAPGRPTRCRSR